MRIYRGVVRGGVIELTEPAELAEGAAVEVLVGDEAEEAAREWQFLEYLFQEGVIERLPLRKPPPGAEEWAPVEIVGPPLSQTIIEDRR